MEEIIIKVDIPAEFKKEFESALSKIVKQFVKDSTLLTLKERLESKEEKELIKWSVELGESSKKGRFNRLLSELPSKQREELSK